MKFLTSSMIAGMLMVLSGTASALPILSFDDGATINTGTVSYDGSGGAMTGTNIDFLHITGFGTALNDGVALDCVSCFMSFTTGNNITEGSSAFGDDWVFGAGGSISITGTVKNGATVIASGSLLTGNFLEADVTGTGFLSELRFDGIGIDFKNKDLLDFFGLGVNSSFIHVETAVSLGNVVFDDVTGGFSADVTSADLVNAVPEPAITALLGMGLVGIGIARRRVR